MVVAKAGIFLVRIERCRGEGGDKFYSFVVNFLERNQFSHISPPYVIGEGQVSAPISLPMLTKLLLL